MFQVEVFQTLLSYMLPGRRERLPELLEVMVMVEIIFLSRRKMMRDEAGEDQDL